MATYAELFNLRRDDGLRNRIAVAAVVKAQSLLALPSPTTAQLTWAQDTFKDPNEKAKLLMEYVLAANKGATVAQIESATDTTIQTNVDTAVDKLLTLIT